MAGEVALRGEWTETHAPADNTQATCSHAATASYRHIVTSISITLEGAANAAAVIFQLRDSTTGAGNVLATWKIANLANDSKQFGLTGLNIRGVTGQAVTLESSAAPAASSSATVNMSGYTERVG